MTDVARINSGKRMIQVVIFGSIVWLAGQCGTAEQSVTEQTGEALGKIERLLQEAGSDKTIILSATIW